MVSVFNLDRHLAGWESYSTSTSILKKKWRKTSEGTAKSWRRYLEILWVLMKHGWLHTLMPWNSVSPTWNPLYESICRNYLALLSTLYVGYSWAHKSLRPNKCTWDAKHNQLICSWPYFSDGILNHSILT